MFHIICVDCTPHKNLHKLSYVSTNHTKIIMQPHIIFILPHNIYIKIKPKNIKKMFENQILQKIHESNRATATLIFKPIYRIIVLIQALGLLITSNLAFCKTTCPQHNRSHILESRKRLASSDNECYQFRCTNPKCRKSTTIQFNSFFSLFRKPLHVIVQVIKCWSIEMTKTIEIPQDRFV